MSRLCRTFVAVWLIATPVMGAVTGHPKRPYDDREDDAPRQHVEVIDRPRYEYGISFEGTVDGTMTRMPVGYAAFAQGWQPNRSVTIENIGVTDVKNPRLVVGGRADWHSLSSIVAEATRGCASEADRARAIYEFVRRQRFHACTWDGECSDALKALNVYGYTLCGNQAQVIRDLWNAAGLKTRRCYPIGHCVTEVFYDGAYHLMDSDEHVLCLSRDNRTIAGAEDIVRDHDLVKRTHTYGIGGRDSRKTDEFSASLYSYEGRREGDYALATKHNMDLVLRPGESIELRWDHIGKQYTAGQALEEGQKRRDGLGDLLAGWGETAYDNMRNGRLQYRPDLRAAVASRGTSKTENVVFDTVHGCARVENAERVGQMTWQFTSPYVFVGGCARVSVEMPENGKAEWHYATDGRSWKTLASVTGAGKAELAASLDKSISLRGKPDYVLQLRLSLYGDTVITDVSFEYDIQTSALSLPELTVGENRIVYTDANEDSRKVRVTHHWLERSAWHPPEPPANAISPSDGAKVEGTAVRFAWDEASDPDGDRILDYHFELSEHADMRWPLSPNFEKRIANTPSKSKTQWTVPYVGLLNPETTYFWRVRALDETGVWGSWSRTFSFCTVSPGVPLDVSLTADKHGGFVLSWKANLLGSVPVSYKVYGSDERGFSVSDDPYPVFRGRGYVNSIDEYDSKTENAPDAGLVTTPGNLVGPTKGTELRIVGPDVNLPNANKAFYRVVAVDSKGRESGPSDYAQVPRPFVFTRPPEGKVGVVYTYRPQTIRSIGDLRCQRSPSSSYNAAFWDREDVAFKAVNFPDWLAIDSASGLISGTPREAGLYPIVLEVCAGKGKTSTVAQQIRIAVP